MGMRVYGMTYTVWDKIAQHVAQGQRYCDFEEETIQYIEEECGLVDTDKWWNPPEDDWDSDEIYYYKVVDKKKFTWFMMRWHAT